MSFINLSTVEPFEICSIRPPTENDSLTFRLTRNCGWNRCLFCPVYKYGARFSRRSMEEVKKDIQRVGAPRVPGGITEKAPSSSFPF
jgi:hypothetical protein